MRLASSVAPGLCHEGRLARLKQKGAMMKILTVNDLWHMTKIELTTLEYKLALSLPELAEGSPERFATLSNLRTVRHVLIRYRPAPAP